MRLLPLSLPSSVANIRFPLAERTIAEADTGCREPRQVGQAPFGINGPASLGREIDPSKTSFFTSSTRLELAKLFDRTLEQFAKEGGSPRFRIATQILVESGLSNGHFDPMFWLIDEWFNARDRGESILRKPVRPLAVIHYQKAPSRTTSEEAARWIAVNVIRQKRDMNLDRWPYLRSRSMKLFGATSRTDLVQRTNEYWRSDGAQGGVWFYPSESFRDESPRGEWMVISRLPKEFTYRFMADRTLAVAILPGPLPPSRIIAEGHREKILEQVTTSHGGLEAFLAGLGH